MNGGFTHGGPVESNVETLRRALQGHNIVAGGNAPGRLTRRPPDPEGVVEARVNVSCPVASLYLFDPFRVGRGGVAGYRWRCLRLLYESPSGIPRKPIPQVSN